MSDTRTEVLIRFSLWEMSEDEALQFVRSFFGLESSQCSGVEDFYDINETNGKVTVRPSFIKGAVYIDYVIMEENEAYPDLTVGMDDMFDKNVRPFYERCMELDIDESLLRQTRENLRILVSTTGCGGLREIV